MHDWQQDFAKAHISYVVTRLLFDAKIKPGKHSKAVLLPQLERQFWRHSLRELCEETLRQLVLSRQAFQASGLFTREFVFLKLIQRLEQGIINTMNEQKRAVTFLKAYTKENSPN